MFKNHQTCSEKFSLGALTTSTLTVKLEVELTMRSTKSWQKTRRVLAAHSVYDPAARSRARDPMGPRNSDPIEDTHAPGNTTKYQRSPNRPRTKRTQLIGARLSEKAFLLPLAFSLPRASSSPVQQRPESCCLE